MSGERILLGFGEALSTPEVVQSLLDAGYELDVAFRSGSRSAARRLRGIQVVEVTAPESDFATCLNDLRSLALARSYIGFLPLEDASLVVADSIESEFKILGPNRSQRSLALDKSKQFERAIESGFDVPSYCLIEGRTRSEVAGKGGLENTALILKPAHAGMVVGNQFSRGDGFRYFESIEESEDWINSNPSPKTRILQRVVLGIGGGGFGIATSEGCRSLSGHQRVRMMNPAGSGSSACRDRAVTEELRRKIERFCSGDSWEGMFMIELLIGEHSKEWFMELNGRAWGSMALARRRGLEYPAWHVGYLFHSIEPPDIEGEKGVLCRHLGREIVHLLFLVRGNKEHAANWPSFPSSLLEVLRFRFGDSWYNRIPHQFSFIFRDALATVRAKLGA